jgi:hypothetical protein
MCSYAVDEAYQILRPHPPSHLGQRLPGIKQMALTLWNMSDSRARDHHREHAARALPHNRRVTKYVQNTISLTLSPHALPIQAITELFFPSAQDFQDNFIRDEESAPWRLADMTQVQSTTSLFAGEYLVKGTEKPTGLNVDFLSYISA